MRKTVAVMSDRSLSLTLFPPVYKNNEICFIVEKLNESIKSSGIGFVSCFSHKPITSIVDFVGGALGSTELFVKLIVVDHDSVNGMKSSWAFFPRSKVYFRHEPSDKVIPILDISRMAITFDWLNSIAGTPTVLYTGS